MYCSRVIKALWAGCAGGMVLVACLVLHRCPLARREESGAPLLLPAHRIWEKKKVIVEMTLPTAEIRSGYQARANTIISSLCDYNWFGNEHVRGKNTLIFIPFLQN